METTKLAHVKLSDIIVSSTNEMFREKAELTADALHELIESVKTVGVIQSILIRPVKDKKFELVCGERRFCAAGFAGLTTIPATIQDLSDADALDIQIQENLHRKDVHPAREAKAYKMMMDKAKCDVKELALRVGKTEHYVVTRIKLNDLVPEAMKDFHGGLMSLGHALLIAKLEPADQKEVIEECTRSYQLKKREVKYYETIHELEEFVNDRIICNLSAAAFKKDDATLLPKAGACTLCPKRSGANQLFADMEDKDRCFDRSCFREKKMLHTAQQIAELIEKKPDIVFLERRSEKLHPSVMKVLQEHKIKTLKEYDDYSTYNYGKNPKLKGLILNGDDAGKMVTVYDVKSKSSGGSSSSAEGTGDVDPKEAIARIKERLERAEELDAEKVYARILEALENHPTQKEPDLKYYNSAEDVFLNFILFDKLRYQDKEEFREKVLKLTEKQLDNNETLFKKLESLDTAERVFMIRKIMLGSYSANIPDAAFAFIMLKVAEGYGDIPIAQYQKEQQEIREKRVANAEKRIQALKPAKSNGVKSKTEKRSEAKEEGKGMAATKKYLKELETKQV